MDSLQEDFYTENPALQEGCKNCKCSMLPRWGCNI